MTLRYYKLMIDIDTDIYPQNDLLCVEWDVKLYTHSLTHSL